MRIAVTEVNVDDRYKARAFYTQVLGLRGKTNAPDGDGARSPTVVSPNEPNGTRLLRVASLDDAAKARQESRRKSGPSGARLADDRTALPSAHSVHGARRPGLVPVLPARWRRPAPRSIGRQEDVDLGIDAPRPRDPGPAGSAAARPGRPGRSASAARQPGGGGRRRLDRAQRPGRGLTRGVIR